MARYTTSIRSQSRQRGMYMTHGHSGCAACELFMFNKWTNCHCIYPQTQDKTLDFSWGIFGFVDVASFRVLCVLPCVPRYKYVHFYLLPRNAMSCLMDFILNCKLYSENSGSKCDHLGGGLLTLLLIRSISLVCKIQLMMSWWVQPVVTTYRNWRIKGESKTVHELDK